TSTTPHAFRDSCFHMFWLRPLRLALPADCLGVRLHDLDVSGYTLRIGRRTRPDPTSSFQAARCPSTSGRPLLTDYADRYAHERMDAAVVRVGARRKVRRDPPPQRVGRRRAV